MGVSSPFLYLTKGFEVLKKSSEKVFQQTLVEQADSNLAF